MTIVSGSKVWTTCINAETHQHKHLHSLKMIVHMYNFFSQVFVPFKNVHGNKTKEGQGMCLPMMMEATLLDKKLKNASARGKLSN